jgi:RNA polymerase sigma factor (sigma-70 family)
MTTMLPFPCEFPCDRAIAQAYHTQELTACQNEAIIERILKFVPNKLIYCKNHIIEPSYLGYEEIILIMGDVPPDKDVKSIVERQIDTFTRGPIHLRAQYHVQRLSQFPHSQRELIQEDIESLANLMILEPTPPHYRPDEFPTPEPERTYIHRLTDRAATSVLFGPGGMFSKGTDTRRTDHKKRNVDPRVRCLKPRYRQLPEDFDVEDTATPGDTSSEATDLLPTRLRAALSQLSERDAQIVNLRYGQGMKLLEVARLLKTTPAAIYQAHRRLLNALRLQLAG